MTNYNQFVNEKKIAIILGGTVPHRELIRQLKNRGYYTILVDYLDNPPAKEMSDEHIQESTLDYDKVLEISTLNNASLVMSACVDQANVIACKVSEKLGLPHPYSSQTAAKIANKVFMKKELYDYAIPTAEYKAFCSVEETVNLDINFPMIVKPADSNSSNMVKIANDQEEFVRYLSDAIEYSRCGQAVVEEYMRGKEISAYFFIEGNRANLLMISEKINYTNDRDGTIKHYATFIPAEISSKAYEKIIEMGQDITDAFTLKNTPIFLQTIVTGDTVRLIEFAPRVGGCASFETIKAYTGFDMINSAIDSWLEIPVRMNFERKKSMLMVCHIYGRNGIYSHIHGIEDVTSMESVVVVHNSRKRGEYIDEGRPSSSRICYFVIKGNSRKELIDTAQTIYKKIDVIDIEGNSIFQREICWKS